MDHSETIVPQHTLIIKSPEAEVIYFHAETLSYTSLCCSIACLVNGVRAQ